MNTSIWSRECGGLAGRRSFKRQDPRSALANQRDYRREQADALNRRVYGGKYTQNSIQPPPGRAQAAERFNWRRYGVITFGTWGPATSRVCFPSPPCGFAKGGAISIDWWMFD